MESVLYLSQENTMTIHIYRAFTAVYWFLMSVDPAVLTTFICVVTGL